MLINRQILLPGILRMRAAVLYGYTYFKVITTLKHKLKNAYFTVVMARETPGESKRAQTISFTVVTIVCGYD